MDAQPESVDPVGEETTLTDEEWPVAELYRVELIPAEPEDGDPAADADSTLLEPAVLAQPAATPTRPARRFPPDPGPGLLLAVAAVVLISAAVWLVANSRDGVSPPVQAADAGAKAEEPASASTTLPTPASPVSPEKTVPEVVGLTLDQARPLLARAGLRVRVERVASERPAGVILVQSPAAREGPSPNGVVLLTVAGAPKQVAVPEVLGMPASEATNVLREAGLQPEIRTVRSTEEAGTVIGQTPAADEKVDRDAVVRLEIATGSQTTKPTTPTLPTLPPRVEIPGLVGLTSAEARGSLRELGLRSTVTLVESQRPEGIVIRQSPRAGAEIREGGTVTLRVSTGPATIAVPDVVGVDEQTARQQLEDAGFIVETVDEPTSDPGEDGVVLGQTPSAGADRAAGTVVTLRVARSG